MNKKDLCDLIASFTMDIGFEYKGLHGLIFPGSAGGTITLYYGDDEEAVLQTAEEVMAYPMFDGKCFNDICETIDFDY